MPEFGLSDLRYRNLTRRHRLVLAFAVGVVSIILLYSVVYNTGMRVLEDRPQTIFQSFQTVVETMTTTGYGADSPWSTPAMNLLVVAMQATGVLIGFGALRALVIPLFESTAVNLDDRLSTKRDHVVVAEYQRDTGVLLEELAELGVDYVLVESEVEEAKALSDAGYQVIDGDPERRRDLDRASIASARTLITDTGERTASVVLTALEANEDLRVISFTASTRRKAALAEVGVDRSVAPHVLVGERLAEKATLSVAVDSGTDIEIREVLVRRDSPLHGTRVSESPLAAHPDLTLVAGWFDGELRVPPGPGERLTPNTVLVVAGPSAEIDAVAGELSGVRTSRIRDRAEVIVAGLGEGGRAAVGALPEGTARTTVDPDPSCEPDVLGDVTEPETLEAAGIDGASALIVTVGDDATALLTVAMARALAADVEILVRVSDAEKASAAFRAGADYVLPVQRVAARLVAAEVHGERVMDPTGQIRLVRADATPFVGQSLAEVRRTADRAWTVVGVVRDGAVLTGAGTAVVAGDEALIAGGDAAIREFERTVDAA